MVVQNVLNYHENNFIMQEIPKTGFGYFMQNTISYLPPFDFGVKFNLDMILWDFCGNDTSNRSLGFFILLLLSSTIYSGHFCSIISRPAPSNLIWITFKNEVRRLTLIWKSDIPKESYNSNTQTDHHYKLLCNNTNGSVSTQSCQRDTSIRLIRMVILFALVLYKRKKTAFHLFFQFFSCHSC